MDVPGPIIGDAVEVEVDEEDEEDNFSVGGLSGTIDGLVGGG
jgi:hypothetical protein